MALPKPPSHLPLTLIRPQIIERLAAGRFVARRQSEAMPLNLADRRDQLSPLAVIKRCIRYEPAVFDNRSRQLLEIAALLNHPENRVIMLSGAQGSGKTSLARGVVELMGGGAEQALWFDVHRYTDAQELIGFLVEYVQYLHPEAAAGGLPLIGTTGLDPLAWLDWLLEHLEPMPLLLVIDNVEHLVNDQYQLRSHPLKQALNALVTLPQIRLMLLGEVLPLADITVQPPLVQTYKVGGLQPNDWVSLMQRLDQVGLLDTVHADKQIELLYAQAQGSPWLLRTLNLWLKHFPALGTSLLRQVFREAQSDGLRLDEGAPLPGQNTLSTNEASIIATPLLRHMVQVLPNHLQQVAGPLALIRHPMNDHALQGIMTACFPTLAEPSQFNVNASPLRPLMKKTYPPQRVMVALQHRQEDKITGNPLSASALETIEPWFEFYQPVKHILQPLLSESLRRGIHTVLQQFYLKQKAVPREQRLLPLPSRVLLAEAAYHGQFARQATGGSPLVGLESLGDDLAFNPYTAQTTAAMATAQRRYTLADYRQITVPTSSEPAEVRPRSGFQATLAEVAGLPDAIVPLPSPSPSPFVVASLASNPTSTSTRTVDDTAVSATPPGKAGENKLWQQLTQAIATQNHSLQAACWLGLAQQQLAQETNESALKDAENYLNHALGLADHLSPLQKGQVLAVRGGLYQMDYRDTQAMADLTQAVDLLTPTLHASTTLPADEHAKAQASVVNSLVAMGEIFQYRGQSEQAKQKFEQAIQVLSAPAHTQDDANERLPEIHYKLGSLLATENHLTAAKTHYEQALRLDLALNQVQGASLSAMRLGELALVQDQLKAATRHFQQAKRLAQQAGDNAGVLQSLFRQAEVALSQDAVDLAIQLYQQALALAVTAEQPAWKSSVYAKLGNVYRKWDQPNQAITAYQAAIAAGRGVLSQASLDDLSQRLQAILS
jgi:tetratricopeptide (TPR) repeat protein